jgi:hypothetical protein
VKGNNDSTERLERTPAVDWNMFIDCQANRLEILGPEYGDIVKILLSWSVSAQLGEGCHKYIP